MASVGNADRLFIHGNEVFVLRPTGEAEVVDPSPELIKTFYIAPELDLPQTVANAAYFVALENSPVFCVQNAGREDRTGFLFEHKGKHQIVLEYGRTPWATMYEAKRWPGFGDRKEWGIFLTGPGETSLWRITRAEGDHIGRTRLTLRPANPPTGFSHADFSNVGDTVLRQQIEGNWNNLQEHFFHRHLNETVTASKNVIEGLLAHLLATIGQPHGGDLKKKLERIKGLIDSNPSSVPLGEMEYHLAEKIRILHQRTHPERAARLGRTARPEFTLGCVEDLIEMLSSLGYTRQ